MLQIKEIPIPIYEQTIYLIFGNPYEAQRYLHSVYNGDFSFDPKTCNGICLHSKLKSWIWFDLEAFDITILMHEICHAIFDLFSDMGLELSDQEAFCYLISYIIKQCKNIFAIQMDLTKIQSNQEDDHQ